MVRWKERGVGSWLQCARLDDAGNSRVAPPLQSQGHPAARSRGASPVPGGSTPKVNPFPSSDTEVTTPSGGTPNPFSAAVAEKKQQQQQQQQQQQEEEEALEAAPPREPAEQRPEVCVRVACAALTVSR